MTEPDNEKWYFLEDGRSTGPKSSKELAAMVATRRLTLNVLVWRPSQNQEWKPLGSIPEITSEVPPPLPYEGITAAHSEPVNLNSKNAQQSVAVHPWRRFFARTLDTQINGVLIMLLISAVMGATAPATYYKWVQVFRDPDKEFVTAFFVLILVMIPNAVLIGYTGASLGKLIFGIRVTDKSGRAIGFRKALVRELQVWGYGLAFGLPFFNLATMLWSNSRIRSDRITLWDKNLGLSTACRPNSIAQIIMSLLGLTLIIGTFVVFRAK